MNFPPREIPGEVFFDFDFALLLGMLSYWQAGGSRKEGRKELNRFDEIFRMVTFTFTLPGIIHNIIIRDEIERSLKRNAAVILSAIP